MLFVGVVVVIAGVIAAKTNHNIWKFVFGALCGFGLKELTDMLPMLQGIAGIAGIGVSIALDEHVVSFTLIHFITAVVAVVGGFYVAKK